MLYIVYEYTIFRIQYLKQFWCLNLDSQVSQRFLQNGLKHTQVNIPIWSHVVQIGKFWCGNTKHS